MNHYYKTFTALAVALCICLSMAGCSFLHLEELEDEQTETEVVIGSGTGRELAATYKADHIFSLNSVADDSFNPYSTSSAWNRVVAMLAYETLVTTDSTFTASPNLITRWETEDGKYWRFYVDTSRSFHDGGVMTPNDAVYSIERAMWSEDGAYARRFSHVKGAYPVDEESFVVELGEANFRFYELLNIPCIEYGSGYDDMPPGTGPYQFNRRGTMLTLDQNHPLAQQMPLEKIYLKRYTAAEDILQAFEDSYLDLVVNNPTSISSLGYSRTNITKYVDTTNLHYIGFNMSSRLFSNAMYRTMMTYAIDRDTIVSGSMQGAAVAATLPIHPNSPLYPVDIAKTLEYSEDGFATAMQNMGATDVDYDGVVEFAGTRATVNFLVCSDSSAKVSAARQISAQLRNAGFEVNLRELDYDTFVRELGKGNFDMYYGEVKLCTDWDLSILLTSGGSINYGNVWDQTLANDINAFLGSRQEDLTMNTEILCQYLAQNAPIIAVCFEKSEVLYHRGVLSGLNPTQDNLFYNMDQWEVDLD